MKILVPKKDGKRFIALSLLAILLLIVPSPAQECPISIHPSSNLVHPDISGDRVVWEDRDSKDIILLDLSDGIETDLTPDGPGIEEKNPVISGSLIAWEASTSPFDRTEIILLNLTTHTMMTLTTNGSSPALSANYVAWVNYTQNRYDSNISVYNMSSGNSLMDFITFPQDRPTGGQPAISGDNLIWVNGSTNQYISMKNILTGVETLIYTSPFGNPIPMGGDISNPGISGDWITWSETDGDYWYVYLLDLTGLTEQAVLTDNYDPTFSSVDDDRIVWSDGTNIFLASVSDVSTLTPLSSGGVNSRPEISGDRVSWYKNPGGPNQIYLSTIASPLSCPAATFTAFPTSGVSPLTVQFSNSSTGSPTHQSWELGDGTTYDGPNPVHIYQNQGKYTITHTVSNPVGRDLASVPDYINAGVVSFSANQTYGIAPLPVQFTNSSIGDPAVWSWDFGDGALDSSQNPAHTYTTPGTYSVTLSGTSPGGTGTRSRTSFIRVLNGANLLATTDIEGLLVQTVGGRQEITLDTTKMVSDTFDPGSPVSFSFTPQPSNGWQTITFSSTDGIGFALDAGGTIWGNLSSCTLESRAIVPATFTTDIGNNLPVSYRLDLSAYPANAEINTTIWEGAIQEDNASFRKALAETSQDFTSIIDTAYTLSFVSRNLDHVLGASLNLSVSSAWVLKNGNQNNIAVVRLGDDLVNQTLIPASTFTDTAGDRDYYTVPSPNGLSRFALVSATGSSNLIQMGTRLATQLIQSSGTGHSSNDYQGTWESSPRQANPPAERPAATYYGEGKIDTTVGGIARDPVIITTADHGASLAIDAGTEAFDSMREPLTLATARTVTAGSIPAMPEGAGIRFTGMAYDMGPDGATFSPPATISFTVPDNQWDPNVRYSIRTYSPKAGSWDEIPTTADPGTRIVSGQVSHLCLFGLFAVPAAGPATPTPTIRAPVEIPQVQEKPLPRTPMSIFTGLMGWIYGTIAANPQVSFTFFLTGLAGLYTYTRRSWLSRNRTWITLYLISLTGLLWALYLFTHGGPLWESLFLFTTITGLNLIVHILRFDRIDLTFRARYGSVSTARRW